MAESGIRAGAVALVTGAGAGLGKAAALRLAARGCKVICAGRRLEPLQALAKALGNGAIAFKLDVTDAKDCATLFERLPESHRQIDILVNNAGHDVGGRKRFDEGKMEDFAAIAETNVIGLMRVAHAVLPAMVRRSSGDVVNLGSTAGLRQYPLTNVYAATKAFVHSFSEGLRYDYRETDIRIIEIMPGITRTEFAAARFGGDKDRGDAYYKRFPALMEPDDIARAIIYALDQPRSVTVAQMLVVPTREAV
ncbi:MAG: SDR family oxidoreductase [Rhodospirillales bacterium]